MRVIYERFMLDVSYPADTEMAKAIAELLEPYDEKESMFQYIYIAESMRDALMDGLNRSRNDYRELMNGDIVWLNI